LGQVARSEDIADVPLRAPRKAGVAQWAEARASARGDYALLPAGARPPPLALRVGLGASAKRAPPPDRPTLRRDRVPEPLPVRSVDLDDPVPPGALGVGGQAVGGAEPHGRVAAGARDCGSGVDAAWSIGGRDLGRTGRLAGSEGEESDE